MAAKFDAETIRVMGLAYEMALVALRLTDRGDLVNEVLASKIALLAQGASGTPSACATACSWNFVQRHHKFRRFGSPHS
jgi:hypothetical protein